MKRHPAFQDLSRDHYTALNRSLQVVRAVDGHPAARPFEHAVHQFRDLWEHDGLREHFLEEETDLLPALNAYGGDDLGQRLLREHEALRQAFGRLDAQQPAHAAETARRLTWHARWEEEVVFEWLQAHVPEAGLQALLQQSQRFRAVHGLAVNPPRS